eukprot:7042405-Prymnesium_polylepis.1
MEALQIVHAMATELRAPPSASAATRSATAAASSAAPSAAAPLPSSSAVVRTVGKTRRWGTSSLRARPVAAASPLGE